MKKLILIIALALVSTGAWGGEYTWIGHGGTGCGKFVARSLVKDAEWFDNMQWVTGFISGGNAERVRSGGNSNVGNGVDGESLVLWIENYCRENPLDHLDQATDALVDELIEKADK